jgi:hypothetical protein
MSNQERIRPRQGPQQSSPELRAEAEAGDKGIVRAPDIGGRAADVDIGPGPLVVSQVQTPGAPQAVYASPTTHPRPAPPPPPVDVQGPLNPEQAAAARLTHNQQNRLGLPRLNDAERLLAAFQEKRAAWKAHYAKTREHSGEAFEAYQEARQAMMAAGLMDPDSVMP